MTEILSSSVRPGRLESGITPNKTHEEDKTSDQFTQPALIQTNGRTETAPCLRDYLDFLLT